MRLLDRYLLGAWLRLLALTTLGFPLVSVLIDFNNNLTRLLDRGVPTRDILVGYVYHLPQDVFLILPAAVLVATVFTVSTLGRRSELTAAIATGQSFHRLMLPIWAAAAMVSLAAVGLGELVPATRATQLRLHKAREALASDQRFNFVYRGDEGWVYLVRQLDTRERQLRDPVLERQGTGVDYPTLLVSADVATYDTAAGAWRLERGRSRIIGAHDTMVAFEFRAMRLRALSQSPADLLVEPKAPDEMRYAELGRYIEALRRSGNDAGKLEVEQALKLAVPATCLIVALFAAPLAITTHRSGAMAGIAVSLATTVLFLLLAQISKAVGDSGVIDPTAAAWIPNGLFLAAALVLLARART